MRPIIACALPGNTFSAQWVANWTQLFAQIAGAFTAIPIFSYSSDVGVTRESLSQHILEMQPRPDYVLWMDDDNLLDFAQFQRLFYDLQLRPEAALIAAWCWCQPDGGGQPIGTSCGQVDEKGHTHCLQPADLQASDELIEVGYTGFPAVLMPIETLERAGKHPFAPLLSEEYQWGKSGEDVAFCVKAKARAGCRFFVDPTLQIPHLKMLACGGLLERPKKLERAA